MNPQNPTGRAISWTMKNYRRYVTYDDLTQLCELYMLEHPTKMVEWENMEETKLAEWRLFKELNKLLGRYARQQKAHQSSYQVEDEVFYNLKYIAELLPAVLAGEHDQPSNGVPEIKAKQDPADGGDHLAGIMDIEAAWWSAPLTDLERNILMYLYMDGVGPTATADALGVTPAAVTKAHYRALNKVLDALGGPSPGRGCPCDCECHDGPLRVRPGVKGADDGRRQMLS